MKNGKKGTALAVDTTMLYAWCPVIYHLKALREQLTWHEGTQFLLDHSIKDQKTKVNPIFQI